MIWILHRKITHYSISSNLRNNRSCRNNFFCKISSNDKSYFCIIKSLKYIIISPINKYLGNISIMNLYKESIECFLHSLTIRFANTYSINNFSISAPERKKTIFSQRDSLDNTKETLSIFMGKFFWICKSGKNWKIEIKRNAKSSSNNRSCPRASPCLINSNKIGFFHNKNYSSEKLLFSKFSLSSIRSHKRKIHAPM